MDFNAFLNEDISKDILRRKEAKAGLRWVFLSCRNTETSLLAASGLVLPQFTVNTWVPAGVTACVSFPVRRFATHSANIMKSYNNEFPGILLTIENL